MWSHELYEYGKGVEELCKELNVNNIKDLRNQHHWEVRLAIDIIHSVTTWMHEVKSIINSDNWVDKSKKPTISLWMEITTKGNFKLEWFPLRDPDKSYLFKKDFICFNDYHGWSEPFNRIIFIHEIDSLMMSDKTRNSMVYFSKAIDKHVNNIISFLKQFVNVEQRSKIFINKESELTGFNVILEENK